MILSRDEAKNLLTFIDLVNCKEEDRYEILLDVYSEDDGFEKINNHNDPIYNKDIFGYLKMGYLGVTNTYLSKVLLEKLSVAIEIKGSIEHLFPCPCCGYKTIEERGQYYICKVCKWEDDGSDSADSYSSVNRMTLKDGRRKFEESKYQSDKYDR